MPPKVMEDLKHAAKKQADGVRVSFCSKGCKVYMHVGNDCIELSDVNSRSDAELLFEYAVAALNLENKNRPRE